MMSTLAIVSSAMVVAIFTAMGIVWIFFTPRGAAKRPGRPRRAPQTEKPFPELRDDLNQASKLVEEASSRIRGFQADIETYVAVSWERETEWRERYGQLVLDLFLLLDHFDVLLKSDKRSSELEWMSDRTRRILEDRGIEEIPVKRGDPFNGAYHKHLDNRSDALPKDSILEVIRRGYWEKGKAGEGQGVWRPAEVVVSRGPVEEQPQSGMAQEADK